MGTYESRHKGVGRHRLQPQGRKPNRPRVVDDGGVKPITVAVCKHVATATLVINGICMALAVIARSGGVFAFGLISAGLAGYGRLLFIDEETRMGKTTYHSVALQLRCEIKQDGYPHGYALPSVRDYARRFNTTRVTVRRALGVLAEENLIHIVPGKGTYVINPAIPEQREAS